MEQRPAVTEALECCRFYRQQCGLPAGVNPAVGRIVVQAGLVWAMTMPAALGQYVKTDMQRRNQALGPTVSHPRSQRWAYLIRPDLPDDMELFAELFRCNVSVIRTGGEIALPSPADHQTGFRRWVQSPQGTFRPSGLVVLTSVRSGIRQGLASV
ncbi:DNA-directed RNA polymerase subunit beta [Nocardia sp. NPDC005825]|uniref:DNA-directed RNA polymerase subunit beta n=1 Tax=unclassified Nocardia TaxID=2637762 RepID=UPI0033DAA122